MRVREDDVMANTSFMSIKEDGDEVGAYIQGSVVLSPTGDHVRSLVRPGAKRPVPYPRAEMHHGSLKVILCR